MAYNEKSRENLAKGNRFKEGEPNPHHAKGVQTKLNKKFFVEILMKSFHSKGRDKATFEALIQKAMTGDIGAIEQIRKWVFGEETEALNTNQLTLDIIVKSQEEKEKVESLSDLGV